MIAKIAKIILQTLVVFLLTAISQIGGVIYLLSLCVYPFLNKGIAQRYWRVPAKALVFAILYLVSILVIVPPIAKHFGRIRLPIFEKKNIKPHLVLTWLLNRNYVTAELRDAIFHVEEEMIKDFPESKIVYLDANFPFWNGFPLLPHLSHNDGKKLDIAFLYRDKLSGRITDRHPSVIGYGVCEEPLSGEENSPLLCSQKGYWQYNLLRRVVSQKKKELFDFDEERTKKLVDKLCSEKPVSKIFIEPHLKTRLGLTNKKIRFHGCQAVRHDDHIHIQVK